MNIFRLYSGHLEVVAAARNEGPTTAASLRMPVTDLMVNLWIRPKWLESAANRLAYHFYIITTKSIGVMACHALMPCHAVTPARVSKIDKFE